MRFAPQENSILKGKKHKRLCEECTARRASSLKKKRKKKGDRKKWCPWRACMVTTHNTSHEGASESDDLHACVTWLRSPNPMPIWTWHTERKLQVCSAQEPINPGSWQVRRQSPNGSTITLPLQRDTVSEGKTNHFLTECYNDLWLWGRGRGRGRVKVKREGGNSRLQAACSLPGHGQHHCRLSTNKRARWLVK
jgi:hypothetical protein